MFGLIAYRIKYLPTCRAYLVCFTLILALMTSKWSGQKVRESTVTCGQLQGESSPGSCCWPTTWGIPTQHTRVLLSGFLFSSVCVCVHTGCLWAWETHTERQKCRWQFQLNLNHMSQSNPVCHAILKHTTALCVYRRVSAYLTICVLMHTGICAFPLSQLPGASDWTHW